ncbi:uncharacterized protein LOC123000313 isoform X2 [Ursus arctos]|uniref:uncharacterized protein LOC123000313 isoform X2 n=1 Tax=Ursus arctos TaxID=9644 RepID=UPI002547BCC0|nr:uncharacterized protein LOC123000313 isoform X2 [Ursus arctos]
MLSKGQPSSPLGHDCVRPRGTREWRLLISRLGQWDRCRVSRKKKILESKTLPKWLKNKRMNRPVAVETPGSDENLPSSDSPRANTPVPSSSAGSWAPARRYRHPAGSGSREETACPEPDCAESTKETIASSAQAGCQVPPPGQKLHEGGVNPQSSSASATAATLRCL